MGISNARAELFQRSRVSTPSRRAEAAEALAGQAHLPIATRAAVNAKSPPAAKNDAIGASCPGQLAVQEYRVQGAVH